MVGGWFFGALTFVGSAYLHPYVRCGTCKGAGRHRGGIFNYAMRPCHACSGAGQQQRLTAQMLGRGRPKVAGSRIAPATKSFGKS